MCGVRQAMRAGRLLVKWLVNTSNALFGDLALECQRGRPSRTWFSKSRVGVPGLHLSWVSAIFSVGRGKHAASGVLILGAFHASFIDTGRCHRDIAWSRLGCPCG